jgi:two-component system, OmpR family, sensor kinase
MKIFRSIKWRLQLWYGLILVVVLAGFGGTAYQLERNRQFRRVDDEIHRRIGALAQQLHGPPRGRQQGRPPGEFRPPPEFAGDDGSAPQREDGPPKLTLAPPVAALFGTNDPNGYFFRVRRFPRGEPRNSAGAEIIELGRSDNYPEPMATIREDHFLNQANHADLRSPRVSNPPPISFQDLRYAVDTLPSGEIIEVGCSIAPESRDLRLAAVVLTATGSIILLLGLLGGWWFVGRSLRPITEISSTATKISAGDLSQRINTAEAESELGQLAAVLNATFARLETAFAQQKQFASDAAHELRTPVTVILTQTQMALGRERDAASYRQTLEACERAAQRMRKLIESLLELARFDAGQEVLKRLRFDLASAVQDSAEMVQTLAEEKRVKIITELEPSGITGDPERLGQVVTNLLTNAIQYNKPDGEVRVKLGMQGGLAVLEITDTGKGISPQDLPRVFERFYRADKSRTGAGNSGLGLSICKAIVEAHGGAIEVASTPDIGTAFTLRLPV